MTRMNKFRWENEEYSYIQKIEEIPESKLETAEKSEKYLYDVKNFKRRHKKLLKRISRKLDVSCWHSYFKVGRFDLLARCINPIIINQEPNKEVILRRHVFKTLYKFSSFAFNRNLLVKEVKTEDDKNGKLMFMHPSWVTPNL
jgi:hypothetical protein